jgi:hypothetical protein
MDGIINCLNINAGSIQAITGILIFFVTFIYVIINSFMHSEMKKNRIRLDSPEISLRIERQCTGFFNLIIENISNISVYNLKFTKYPDFRKLSGDKVDYIGFIKNGINYFAPKQFYSSFFLQYSQNPEVYEKIIEFVIEYENILKKNTNKQLI